MRLGVCVHAAAGVGDSQHHVAARLHLGGSLSVLLVEKRVAGLQSQFAALGHGIPGVDGQVHDDLFHLATIDVHAAQLRLQMTGDFHILADHPAQHLLHVAHDAVEAYHRRHQHLLAAERQELTGDRCRPVARFLHCLHLLQHRTIGRKLREQHFSVADDDSHQVVYVVGHAAGQSSDGLYPPRLTQLFLGLAQRLLRLPALADVAEDEDGAADSPLGIPNARGGVVDGDFGEVLGDEDGTVAYGGHRPFAEGFRHGALRDGAGDCVHNLEDFFQRQAQGVLAAPARQRFCDGVHERNPSFGVGGDHAIADACQSRCVPLLTFPETQLHCMLLEGHLDGDPQLPSRKWLEQIAKGPGPLGPVDGGVVRVRGQIDDRDVESIVNRAGGFDAVQVASQTDVHQHQVR